MSKQNIFQCDDADAICITTNGFVKRSGAAVMGAGVAKQAKERWRFIDYTLGQYINLFGNVVSVLTRGTEGGIFLVEPEWSDGRIKDEVPYHILSFPAKPDYTICNEDKSNLVPRAKKMFKSGDRVPGFYSLAQLNIIEDSCKRLSSIADLFKWNKVVLPAPGCGNGGLTWAQVFPILDKHLDEKFTVAYPFEKS